ncbi:MAG: hypothetical protein Q9216_002496 [Gyalolechia sp. 2 TL-2023]
MRRIRFREDAGLLSWSPREGSEGRKKALIQCIPADIMDQILVTNDMSCFRDLSFEETTYISRANKGLNPERAGRRQLVESERERRWAAKDSILKDFEPVNEAAWPYLDNLADDNLATSRARASLGLLPPKLDYAQTSHDALIGDEKAEKHRPGRTGPAGTRSKRFREEDLESSLTYRHEAHPKRRCSSGELARVGINSSKPRPRIGNCLEPLIFSDYDHEARNYAQYLEPKTSASLAGNSIPSSTLGQNILGEEASEFDIAQGRLNRTSISLATIMNPFSEQHKSSDGTTVQNQYFFQRGPTLSRGPN